MDFGRIPEHELDQVDFTLPVDPSFNNKIFSGKQTAKPVVYFGCAKWGRKEWIGKIYPKGTKDANFLDHYVHHYNAIELNATHYQLYGPSTIAKWADKVKEMDFKFCPKVYQGISHYGTFENKHELTDGFLQGIVAFGERLGPIFLQVSDRFSPKRKDELLRYLEVLPTDLQFFLEVRHPEWYKGDVQQEMFEHLQQLRMGSIITDTAGRRDMVHMHLTIPKTFIRFVGNSLHASDYKRCDDWVMRIREWLAKGLQELYFFMHMHDEAFSPELTVYLAEKLNKECGLDLIVPKFVLETDTPKTKVSGKSKNS